MQVTNTLPLFLRRHVAYVLGMLKNLLDRLLAPADTSQLPDDDARTALTALLIRAAKEDGHYAQSEKDAIKQIVSERFGGDIEALIQDAEAFESEAGDTVRITRLIKDGVPYEERLGVVEALWTVVLADDQRSAEENALLRLVASLIGVSDQESGLARQRVAAKRTRPAR